MNKIRLIIITVILIATVGIAPIYADMITEGPIISDDIVSYSTISNALKEELKNAGEDDLIPVAIELKDDIDLEEVDRLALSRAELSTEEVTLMTADISGLSEEEQEIQRQKQIDIMREVSRERIDILVDHYTDMNDAFIKNIGIEEERIGYVGSLTSFIREVMLTPAEIRCISLMDEVCCLDYDKCYETEDMASINDTYQIINGDVAVSNGDKGYGIRVGVIEEGHPLTGPMTSDCVYMNKTDDVPIYTPHATMVCGIIKKMAHDCNIYTRFADDTGDINADCEHLINECNVDVINLSSGVSVSGVYDVNSRVLDQIAKNSRVPIVVATGKLLDGESSATKYINQMAISPNVIAVGGVDTTGTDQSASGAYTLGSYSLYLEGTGIINRPDICAPGDVQIYSYSDRGTSFAAPHITGTIVQMLYKKPSLKTNAVVIKALLLASASYNAGTSMNYAGSGTISNYEGAGVVDAGFCYQMVNDYTHMGTSFDADSPYVIRNITVTSTTKPLRIACAWDVISTGDYGTSGTTYITDYDLKIYKDGTLVGASSSFANSGVGSRTNYEIVELSPTLLNRYGTGTYQIKIMRSGSYYGNDFIRVGLAWGQQ